MERRFVDEAAALVRAANHGALEWHPWTSRTDAPHLPSYASVDFDPRQLVVGGRRAAPDRR